MFIFHKLIESILCGSNIQHSRLYFHKEKKVLQKKQKAMLPTIMLKCLGIINSFASGMYMYDISNMIFWLHHLHLDYHFIQQKYELNFRYLCQYYYVSTSVDIYLCYGNSYFMLEMYFVLLCKNNCQGIFIQKNKIFSNNCLCCIYIGKLVYI